MLSLRKSNVVSKSDDFHNLAAANTTCAHFHAPNLAIDVGAHGLQVGQPAPFRQVMSVTDIVANQRTFATNVTSFCHYRFLLFSILKPKLV